MGQIWKMKLLSSSIIILLLIGGLPFMFEFGSEHSTVQAAKTIIVDINGMEIIRASRRQLTPQTPFEQPEDQVDHCDDRGQDQHHA